MKFKTLPIIIFTALIGVAVISFLLRDYLVADILIIGFLVIFYYYVVRYEIKNELSRIRNDFKRIEERFERLEKILLKEEVRLERDIKHAVRLSEINPELDKNIVEARKRIVPTTLQLRMLENGEMGYRFTLPDGNYTDAFTRSGIQDVVREVAVLARSVKGYSFYVSGIDLSHVGMKLYRNFTSFAFTEKNMFELLMEKGVQALGAR